MKRINSIFSGLIALFLFLASGPITAQEYAITDARITDHVDSELFLKADVPANDIDVTTAAGIVTLNGMVNNVLAKERSEKLAMSVKGVRGVVNKITVNPPNRSDKALTDDITKALLRDPATDSYEIDVMVKNGRVTLNGAVQSWQEKQLCAYVAKGVKGVRSLSNNLDIEDTTERADAEIKLEVEEAIANDIRLYEKLIDVRVKDGIVGLSGTVGSLNEKQLAVSYAWTPGVESVSTSALDINDWATNPRLRTEAYPSRTDKEIKSAIEDAFFYDPRVYEFNTKVTVDNGVAVLSGKVDNLKAKRAAENDARNVVGVTFVRNNIRVKPDYIPENQSLEALIASSITLDPELEFYEIDVSALSGKVYLEGKVDSWYEKYKAEDVASRVNGVTSIVNNLDIRETADFDYYYPMAWNPYPYPYISPEGYYDYPATDAQIYDNIQSELFWSPFVNKDDVVVTVNQGVATLSGTVDSPQERSSAVENAYEGGATSVIDMMKVSTGIDAQ